MAVADAPMLFQGVSKDSKAFRLMTQMGWQEGSGLGKDKQGIKSHIRVKTRKDNSGVGTDEQKKAAANWTVNTHIFDNILKNLKVKAAEPEKTKDENKKGSSDEDSSDDESVEALPVVKKVARPQGRYKRREGGKLVKGYSATDLNAILGGKKDEAARTQAPPIEKIVAAEIKVAKSKEEVAFLEMECEESIPLPEIAADWWGTKYGFVRSGALGSKVRETVNGERPSENGRTQFSEQDQENLYNLVTDKATKGKKGLGQGERALKIEGVKITSRPGQKKVFANMEESDEDEAQDAVSSDSQGEPVKLEKKRKRDETSGNESPLLEGSKIKLKELVSQFLTEAPDQKMSLKRLQKRVTTSTGLFSSKDDADTFREKLLKSSKFLVEKKKVSLKSRS